VHRAAIACLTVLSLCVPAGADILVTTLDSRSPVRGISMTADADAVLVQTAAGEVERIPTARVVEIATVPEPAALPPASHPFELELVDGSRVRGVLRAGQSEQFVALRSPVLGNGETAIDVDLDRILAVRRADGTTVPGASRLVRIADRDAAYRLSGARVEGLVARFTNTGLEMDRGDLGTTEVTYGDLAALFFDAEPLPPPAELRVAAHLADGSRLLLAKGFRVTAGQLVGETASGLAVRVPTARIVALGLEGGSFTHLSDLEPEAVERVPFFPLPEGPAQGAMLDFVCPVNLDRSPDGHPITLHGRRYFKGIGVRPTTTITWDLGAAYQTFESLCGIDDEVLGPGYGRGCGTGSVVFQVKVDGKTVFESEPVEGGREPVPVRVSVAGARKLTLVVTLVPQAKMPKGSADAPELDNAVWARPLLIR